MQYALAGAYRLLWCLFLSPAASRPARYCDPCSACSLQVRAMQGGAGLAVLRLREAMAAITEGKPLLVGDLEVSALVLVQSKVYPGREG